MSTISLCMIVKNESHLLQRCLESLHDLMDEIIIVDTGSTDNTKEIALNYTAHVYDYVWQNDFSDARNFAFSKAKMEYIYTADADEYLDDVNRERFAKLKKCLLPEIEIVQMYYVTPDRFNTTSNFSKEYRPKLYRRLREFFWIDAIHETIRLDPVVFESEIEIQHLPESLHTGRDFEIFRQIFTSEGELSPKLHSMYAKELLISGTKDDVLSSMDIFCSTLQNSLDINMQQEAACVLAIAYHAEQRTEDFFATALQLIFRYPCSEIAYEIALYFLQKEKYTDAITWFQTAIHELLPVIDVRRSGNLALFGLSECYERFAEISYEKHPCDQQEVSELYKKAENARTQAEQWELTM